jgi:hypothetical protein
MGARIISLRHKVTDQKKRALLFTIPNEDYDPPHLVLVDVLPPSSNLLSSARVDAAHMVLQLFIQYDASLTLRTAQRLGELLSLKKYHYGPTLTYDEVRAAVAPNSDDRTFEKLLWCFLFASTYSLKFVVSRETSRSIGWEVLYTYQGAAGHEFTKDVVVPTRDVAPKRSLRGFSDNYGGIQADVLHLSGEVHLERKPVGISSQVL